MNETVVTYPRWAWVLVWLGFPLLGGGAGWLLKSVAGWIAKLSWAPLQGPFKLIASIPEPHATYGAVGIGAAAGLVLAFLTAQDSLKVTVSDSLAELQHGSEASRAYARGTVTGVFLDAKHLVLQGRDTSELVREKSDLEDDKLRKAFESHGWPWLAAGDPNAADFRRWVQDDPDLPPAANALLKARAKAVSKDAAADLRELRAELAKLGVVVRDEKKKQYWRQLRG